MTVAITDSGFPCVPRISDCLVEDITDDNVAGYGYYDCSQGHFFSIPFTHSAVIPPIWECPDCETIAIGV